MDDAWGALAAVIAIVFAAVAIFFRTKEEKVPSGPMTNTAAISAGEVITKTFKEDVNQINEAGSSDTPAYSLADLGNARRRNRK